MKQIFIVLGTVAVLSVCIVTTIFLNGNHVEDTDLTHISIDHFKVNETLDDTQIEKYTESDRYSGKYKYKFDEIVIDVNDQNQIDYLFARFDETSISISVNENDRLTTIDQVSHLLGNNYKREIADSEQKLSKYIYYDRANGIKAEFIYQDLNSNLLWIVVQEN